MTSQHSNGVVLATCQIKEITVGVGAVAFIIVTEATPGVHSIGCGPTRPIPCYYSNARLTVHSCREVAGNTWSWWTEVEYSSSGFSYIVRASLLRLQHGDNSFIPVLKLPEITGSLLHVFVWLTTLMTYVSPQVSWSKVQLELLELQVVIAPLLFTADTTWV